MPNYYSPDTIQALLDSYKKNKDQQKDYKAPTYQTFVPDEMKTNYQAEPLYAQLQQSIIDRSRVATETQLIKSQNMQDWRKLQQAKRQRNRAQQNFVTPNGPSGPGDAINVTGSWNDPNGVTGIGVGANLRTLNWKGHSITVNNTAANNFVHFLNALYKTGYRPSVIGSYANRNIAGSNTKSLHAYGLAIDIDPGRNPVTYNGQVITALPPGVGALAAKYGLVWGGNWHGSKRDTMHFSVPYGGRK